MQFEYENFIALERGLCLPSPLHQRANVAEPPRSPALWQAPTSPTQHVVISRYVQVIYGFPQVLPLLAVLGSFARNQEVDVGSALGTLMARTTSREISAGAALQKVNHLGVWRRFRKSQYSAGDALPDT